MYLRDKNQYKVKPLCKTNYVLMLSSRSIHYKKNVKNLKKKSMTKINDSFESKLELISNNSRLIVNIVVSNLYLIIIIITRQMKNT